MACFSNNGLTTLRQYHLEEQHNYKLTGSTAKEQYYIDAQSQSQQRQHTQQQRLSRHDLFNIAGTQLMREAHVPNGKHFAHNNEINVVKQALIDVDGIGQAADNKTNASNNNTNDNKNNRDTFRRRRRSGTWPRTRSLNAPPPLQQFGPCGRIMKNPAMVMHIQDPAGQRLSWHKPPLTVLVIKKVSDSTVLAPFVQLVDWLVVEKNMVVWVESAVLEEKLLRSDVQFRSASEKQRHDKFESIRDQFISVRDKLVTFKDGRDDLTNRIDFIICIGGDGTLLYASQLFQHSVPPVMAFHLGSLGFLTPFRFNNFQEQVTNVLEGHAALTLRSRLRCILQRNEKLKETSSCDNKNCAELSTGNTNGITSHNDKANDSNSILVLNDVVISRGLSSYLSNVDLFLDGKYITTVQGDGLIVSTPTGSTAYAVAAGASMIHPSVPAIMVTPICPHSLSFRPIVVPAGVELKISVSPDSRNTSWVSFDGRNRQELYHGDSLRVTTSIYPVPSICAHDQVTDWFDSLANGLHWNVRKRQKCLDELTDLTASSSDDTLSEIGNLKV